MAGTLPVLWQRPLLYSGAHRYGECILQISLARLAPHAYDYLQTGNVLAAALASIMGRPLRGAKRAQLHFDCLEHLLAAERAGEINPATMELLGDVVETYLPLSVEDRTALRLQLQAEGEVAAMETTELTWRSRFKLEVRREDIKRVVQVRLGRLSPEVEAAINAITADEVLDAFFDRALVAQTESDLLRPAS